MTRRTRFGYLAATALAVLVIVGISVAEIAPRLIWNASASLSIGLYRLEPPTHLALGDLVAVDPPEPITRFVTARGYVGPGVPLLKRVAALPGARVCREATTITVNGQILGAARERDRLGRLLPTWQGCRVIAEGEVFLMNREIGDSLDGRYFGPLPATSVIGRVIPLWLRGDGDRHREPRQTPASLPR
ncbi:S26 family signal peptidase (plasmid) [Paracoccus sp. TD-10]|uniref:S26 family signal peptidase n=1 Tax=Paracoccus sp. TD-10 TaxID=3395918 RepID=UPI003AAA7921